MSFRPTLHHLNNSQSQRILWLLEELKIDYKLVNHFRNAKDQLSPPSLKAISPTGSAPALETGDGRVINESIAIATYLLRTYDKDARFGGGPRIDDPKVDWLRDEELTSWAATSFGFIVQIQFIMELSYNMSPWFLKPVFGFVKWALVAQAMNPRMKLQARWLQNKLGDRDYFMGDSPGRADFVLSQSMDMCFERNMLSLEDYPGLKAWTKRCKGREAWKSALNKGNGYDWTAF